MPKNEIEIQVSIKDRFSKSLTKVSSGLKKVSDQLKSMRLKAGIAAAGFTASILKFANAAKIQEKSINALNQALKNQGNFTEEASKDLQKYASELQRVTLFGDETILKAQSLIASFGIEGEELKRLTKASLDLAQAKGMDLTSAADLVAKSVGSSTNALSRYGVKIEGAVGSTERANSAIESLNKLFKGQAESAAKGLGTIDQVRNLLGDLAEEIGFQLAPFIEIINNKLKKFLAFLIDNKPILKFTSIVIGLGAAISGLALSLGVLAASIPFVVSGLSALKIAILPIVSVPGAIALAIGALGVAIFKFRDQIKNVLLKSFKTIIESLNILLDKINTLSRLIPGIPEIDLRISTEGIDAAIEKINEVKNSQLDANNLIMESSDMKAKKIISDLKKVEKERLKIESAKRKLENESKNKDKKNKKKEDEEEIKIEEEKRKLQRQNLQKFNSFISTAVRSRNREVASISKAAAVFQIGVDTKSAAIAAYRSLAPIPIVGPALGAAAAAAAIAFGGEQAAAVQSQSPGFQEGGIVGGSSFQGDKVPIRVNSGEMVLNKEQQKQLFDLANGQNQQGGGETIVNLNVDGNELAQTMVNLYNNGRNIDSITRFTED